MKKFAVLPISLFAALALTACGDDSSSGPDNTTPSSGIEQPESSDGTDTGNPGNSSDGTAPTSSSAVTPNPDLPSSGSTEPSGEFTTEAVALPENTCTTAPTAFGSGVDVTCDGEYVGQIRDDSDPTPFDPNAAAYTSFVGIQKIYPTLDPTDKVVFIMRHANRTASTDVDGVLTGWGYLQSIDVGKKLAGIQDIKYWHSEVPRTLQTCMGIAQGRGQATIDHKALSELNGGWFEKDHAKIEEYNATVPSSYEIISRWAYNEYNDPTVTFNDGFYDLETRGAQFFNEIILAKIAPFSRVSVVISHDQMLYPLVIYVTNRQFEMRYHEDKSWLNFLAGVAVIIKADGTMKYIPLKGLDSGLQ